MQNVSFGSVEEFLDYLPQDELEITLYLRKLILECFPNCTEKLSYNVPFYKRYSNVCFIWPASVLWGKKKTYEGVRLGFTKGYLLQDEIGFLSKENRKQVYWRDFKKLSEIDADLVKSYLFEAITIDELSKKQN
ncbi:DUF1801 domain-containing protein [Leptobacterium flavescens]|uniref:DUF1801 domain-containing protein n=2 Tax=Leptobacterium flavescens TaxID=472055 RepID=A0A6P0UXQ4_9FLAO|nr:DUF1801 domain-containing protein [Leptobacterium flavescens]